MLIPKRFVHFVALLYFDDSHMTARPGDLFFKLAAAFFRVFFIVTSLTQATQVLHAKCKVGALLNGHNVVYHLRTARLFDDASPKRVHAVAAHAVISFQRRLSQAFPRFRVVEWIAFLIPHCCLLPRNGKGAVVFADLRPLFGSLIISWGKRFWKSTDHDFVRIAAPARSSALLSVPDRSYALMSATTRS
jgi:hypothetical protein